MRKTFSVILTTFLSIASFANDIIVTTKSERIEAKVEEVSAEQIKYRKMSNPNGPLFVTPTSEIQLILYDNGEVQFFNKTDNPASNEPEVPEDGSIVKQDSTKKDKKPSNFSGYFELGGIVGKEVSKAITGYNVTLNPVIGGPAIQATFGCKLGNLAFLGAGLGVHTAFGNARDTRGQKTSIRAITIPLYMNTRVFIPLQNSSFRPVAEVSIGLSIPAHVSMNLTYIDEYGNYKTVNQSQRGDLSAFLRVGFGGELNRFVFGIGYELWGNRVDCDHYAYLKLGVRFGK